MASPSLNSGKLDTPAAAKARGPRRWTAVLAATLFVLIAWTGVFLAGTLEGWWRRPIAARGDAQAFLTAAERLMKAEQRGVVTMLLVDDGKVVGERSASIGKAVDRTTMFQIGSVSKWVTALGVMTLVDAGKIDLDAPVETYVKRWKLPPSEFDHRKVTVRRLLSHTAGLTDGLGYGGFAPGQRVQSLTESLTRAADAAPDLDGVVKVGSEPGDTWQYSGGGYTLLQLMIEDVTGQSFNGYMRRAVLEPLGMRNSTFVLPEGSTPRLAEIFDADQRVTYYRRYTATGAASLYSTAEDLARLIAIHHPGPDGPPGRGVVKPATLAEMRKPLARGFGTHVWGLGLTLYGANDTGGYIVGHDGGNYPTINTAVRFDPASGDGIVVLATGEPSMADRLGSEWIFWRTANMDTLTLIQQAPRTLTILGGGALAIIVAGAVVGWRTRRRKV